MPVIAVINRKGGSGKSTVAAHLAAWYAHQGHVVMLGDVDRQQSSRSWLRRRPLGLPKISPWQVDQNILRIPKGITHTILDTPGGLHGFDLARLVMAADAIVMPVCNSLFDLESAAACLAELRALPRISSGRCKLACWGMRLDEQEPMELSIQALSGQLDLLYLGGVRETRRYAHWLEQGLTVFDACGEGVLEDKAQWACLINWLQPVLAASRPAPVSTCLPVLERVAEPPVPAVPGHLHPRSLRAAQTVNSERAFSKVGSV